MSRAGACAQLVVLIGVSLLTLTLQAPEAATPQVGAAGWPDNFVGRLEALALMQTLNADLLSHDSATLTLERWCSQHHLASPPLVHAQRVLDIDKPADVEIRRQLQVGTDEPVRYRRVRLRCGEVELSEADNWYVPARLTGDMARRLDDSDEPFGKVVQALHFTRHTQSTQLLWSPLPDGWEMQRNATTARSHHVLTLPPSILQHRAVLSLPDGTPFSEVVETYSSNVLAFPTGGRPP